MTEDGDRPGTDGFEDLSPVRWKVDPTAVALRSAGRRREDRRPRRDEVAPGQTFHDGAGDPPSEPRVSFCTELGRHLLLAQFEFSSWVLRRVEKVRFEDESRLSRQTSIEFLVPEYAPVLDMGSPGDPTIDAEYWLVPLSVMRRRTLVNLDIRDEDGGSVSMLGLRFTQKLDEALLRAAALLKDGAEPGGAIDPELEAFIEKVVSGNWAKVNEAKEDLVSGMASEGSTKKYFDDLVFSTVLSRMWHNFTLYVALPVKSGRHRRLRLSFDEPATWSYQKPHLEKRKDDPEHVEYRPFNETRPWRGHWKARVGLHATRFRFLAPGAENCASYHFEFHAPQGLTVDKAILLAGRPNSPVVAENGSGVEKRAELSIDCDGGGRSAGLHAVEIPNGSLSRVQVDLRVERAGWLTTLVVSCLAAWVAVLAVLAHLALTGKTPADLLEGDELTNIFVLLVTISAGAATYVAHNEAQHVASKMLAWLRGLGMAAIALPVVVGTMLVFSTASLKQEAFWLRWLGWDPGWGFRMVLLCVVLLLSTVLASLVCTVWVRTFQGERTVRPLSPWSMIGIGDGQRKPILWNEEDVRHDFDRALDRLGFNDWAVGVVSAEGWHEDYAWSNTRQNDALRRLRGTDAGSVNPTRCRCGLHEDPVSESV